MAADLIITDVSAGYDESVVVDGVSLVARSGTITCLLGSNGSGKTTLIKTILGLIRPKRGQIIFDGVDISNWPTHSIVRLGLGCIPEGRRIFPSLTVEENLRIGAIQERSESVVKQRLSEAYDTFPRLQERREQIAGTMSGGEQAMLSIGRGMMGNPRLLIFDEPSLGLAPLFVKENFKLVEQIRRRGITVFLVEQNVRQTLAIADYGYVLSKGRVRASGPASQLEEDAEVRSAYFGTADLARVHNRAPEQ